MSKKYKTSHEGGFGELQGSPITPNADVRQIVMLSFSTVKELLKNELEASIKREVHTLANTIRKDTRDSINAMEQRFYRELSKTDDRVTILSKDLNILKTDVHTLKSDVHALKTDVHTLKIDMHDVKKDMTKLLLMMGRMSEQLNTQIVSKT